MNDYQAIYDAVRSRISNGDVGSVVRDIAWQAFDISNAREMVTQEFLLAASEAQRPFVLLKPPLYPDGNKWCVLYGENLQEGVAGFGDTPDEAARAFDAAWLNERPPSIAGDR